MNDSAGYDAMLRFLQQRYTRLPSADLGALLGELALAGDGRPFDPASTEVWKQAVESIQRASEFSVLQQRRAG